MPEVHELKRSLGLTPGETLGPSFTVREVEAHREVKTPRELYNFKVHIWVELTEAKEGPGLRRKRVADNTLEDAKAALMERVQENEIMYSSYGSPYHVHLSHVRASAPQGKGQKRGQGQQMENWIELEALAVAKRRRDMPRLSEKHGEEGSSADEEEAADDEMKRQGYRVVKAHFKSSHCPVCSEEFIPGEHIAKPAGDKGRGGWAHSVCLANQLQEEGSA